MEPLSELAASSAALRVQFVFSEGPHALECYATGLVTEHPNKKRDTSAQLSPAPRSRP